MTRKQCLFLIILLAGAVALFSWCARSSREPVYQGKALSDWLKDMENWDGDTNDAACVAFQQMGTNAIPALLKIIQSAGSPIQKWITELNQRQSVVNLPFGTSVEKSMAATWGLYAMGTNVEPVVPILTNLLFHSHVLITSTIVLAGIGRGGLPSLLTALTNGDWRIRHSAATGLGWERSDFDIVVPALIASLQDNYSTVQDAAAISLGQLHVEPELAVPALMNAFTNNDALLRNCVLVSLSEFGVKAKEAVPMVITALKDKDETVHRSAGLALKQIDSDAAKNAGVK